MGLTGGAAAGASLLLVPGGIGVGSGIGRPLTTHKALASLLLLLLLTNHSLRATPNVALPEASPPAGEAFAEGGGRMGQALRIKLRGATTRPRGTAVGAANPDECDGCAMFGCSRGQIFSKISCSRVSWEICQSSLCHAGRGGDSLSIHQCFFLIDILFFFHKCPR